MLDEKQGERCEGDGPLARSVRQQHANNDTRTSGAFFVAAQPGIGRCRIVRLAEPAMRGG